VRVRGGRAAVELDDAATQVRCRQMRTIGRRPLAIPANRIAVRTG
jgi:hypothetical protein